MILLTAVLWVLIHGWYPSDCCSDRDCRQINCDDLRRTELGYRYGNTTFDETVVRVSPDGDCHACFNARTTHGRCLFIGSIS
jgi:hypothetical protein